MPFVSTQRLNLNCNKRQERELKNNNYLNQKFCDLKPKIDTIKNKINVIKIIDENTKGGNLSAGDIYVGTENGVYLIHGQNNVDKFNNLNFAIKNIILDGNGSAFVTNSNGKVYHLNLVGWDSEKLEGIESSNLEEEIVMYYKDDKSDLTLENYNIIDNNRIVKTFSLGKTNPLNYKKIEILGNENFWTKNIWGDENYWNCKNIYRGEKTINSINGLFLENVIRNYKFSQSNIADIDNYNTLFGNNISLDNFKREWWGEAWFDHSQSVGFTFYWENGNYYLQFLCRQHADSGRSSSNLKQILKVGNRIRLYNN